MTPEPRPKITNEAEYDAAMDRADWLCDVAADDSPEERELDWLLEEIERWELENDDIDEWEEV